MLEFNSMIEVVKAFNELDECSQEAMMKVAKHGIENCETSIVIEARHAVANLIVNSANDFSERTRESLYAARRNLKFEIDLRND